MVLLIGFLIGFISGAVVTVFLLRERPVGFLMINNQDPEDPPYFFLELTSDVHTVCGKRYIKLKVNTKGYNPQE